MVSAPIINGQNPTADVPEDSPHEDGAASHGVLAKIKVHFVAVGSAPIMKRTKFQIQATTRFSSVRAFLWKMLQLSPMTEIPASSLFVYIQSAFVPGPDEFIGDVCEAFGTGAQHDELIIHYSLQEAWG
jgi:ubiquitin-like protein ATG12